MYVFLLVLLALVVVLCSIPPPPPATVVAVVVIVGVVVIVVVAMRWMKCDEGGKGAYTRSNEECTPREIVYVKECGGHSTAKGKKNN